MNVDAAQQQANLYADAFPAMGAPAGGTKKQPSWAKKQTGSLIGQRINKPGGGNYKDQIIINANERKFTGNNAQAANNIKRIASQTGNATNTSVNVNLGSNGAIKISIAGSDQKSVNLAKTKLKMGLTSQEEAKFNIPKDYHRFILGKGGKQLRELEEKTSTKVRIPGSDNPDSTVTITGSKQGIAACKREMDRIVAKSGSRATEKIDIEKKYHLYIAGAYNETKKQIEEKSGNVVVHIPPNNKADATEITVVGDKEAVARAVQLIQEIYNIKKLTNIEEVKFQIAKESHKYIIGPKYSGIQEIFKKHDVIVEVPDAASDDDHVTLRGENTNLGRALTDVYAMAHSHTTKTMTCQKYLIQKLIGKGGENIKKLNPFNDSANYVKVDFKDDDGTITISGKTENVDLVEKNLRNEIMQLSKNFSFRELPIPQEFHGRIIGKAGANLNALKEGREGLNIRVPKSGEKSDKIIIEGRPKDVMDVYKSLMVQLLDFKNEKEVVLNLEQKYHRYFFQDSQGRDKGKKEEFEIIRTSNADQVNIQFPNRDSNSNDVKIRGPSELVVNVAEQIKRLYDQIVAEHFEGKILIAKKFHRNIIGKQGAQVNKIKESCGVQIEIPANDSSNEVITIIGSKPNVERAKMAIREIENELAKVTEDFLKIPKSAYKYLIGRKGEAIQSLRAEFDVAIQFPDENDKSDKVVIRGEDKQVKAAKAKLNDLANDKIENFYTEEVACPKDQRKFLVGKAGSARIAFQKENDVTLYIPEGKDDKLQVTGKKANVQKAVKALQAKIKELSLLTEKEIEFPKKHHKRLITDRYLNNLKDEFGCTIILPNQNTDSDKIKIKGPIKAVDSTLAKFESLAEKFANEAELIVELLTKDRRALIGDKGETINRLQDKYDVSILIKSKDNGPDAEETTEATLKGPADKLEACHEELKSLVTYNEDYPLDQDFHGLLLGAKGANIQQLSKDLHITIKVPKKDDEDQNTIKLRGTTVNLANAKAELDKLKDDWKAQLEDQYLRSYTCPVEVPIEFHGKLIGPKGSNINTLQKQFDVRVNIKKNDENIEVTGYKDKVHDCVDEIYKFLEDLENHVATDVEIDSKVHYKIIGTRGSKLRALQSEFKVEIQMPRRNDANYEEKKNIVTVIGSRDNVEQCIIKMTDLEAEFLAEEGDDEVDSRFKPSVPGQDGLRRQYEDELRTNNNKKSPRKNQRYEVKDAPWEKQQQAKNDQPAESFPSLGSPTAGGESYRGAWARKI